jgi:3-mercaptopyruvate sulfurtransferase SseA
MGFKNVAALLGGTGGWRAAGLPIQSSDAPVEANDTAPHDPYVPAEPLLPRKPPPPNP